MFNRNSHYALNKKDQDAIVYMDAQGNLVRLTSEDFPTEEEFRAWKAWSDGQYHLWEKADHIYTNCTASPECLLSQASSAPGLDSELEQALDLQEQLLRDAGLTEQVRACLTEKQFRRLWLYEVEEKTEAEIAAMEGVGQRRISSSLIAARKKLEKIFSSNKKQGLK